MIRQYYKLEGEPAQRILNDYYKLTKPLVNKRSEIISEFKEDFNIQGEVMVRPKLMGQNVAIGVIALKTEQTPLWATERELNTDSKDPTYILLIPCLESMTGQLFQNWLDKINKIKIPTFSSFAIGKILGGQKSVMDEGSKHYAVAGFHNSTLVISIPDQEGKSIRVISIPAQEDVNTPEYDMCLVEIKKYEYIAITEEPSWTSKNI